MDFFEMDDPSKTSFEDSDNKKKPETDDLLSDDLISVILQIAQQVKVSQSDDRAWYVVHCYSGYENKVRHNLEQRIETMGMKDKIFDAVPTE